MLTLPQMQLLDEAAARAYRSGLCPPDHKSVDQTFVVMMTGAELGFDPMQSVRLISIVKGKVSLNADTQVALVARSPVCRYFRLTESTDTRATYTTQREGHAEPVALTYTIEQAKTARLTGSQTWQSHPAAMLRARCASALARAVYPDLVAGIYESDEAAEIARSEPAETAPVREAPPPILPAPTPVPASITAATTCAAAARAYHAAVDGTDPSDDATARWQRECLAAAMHACADHGVVLAPTKLKLVAHNPTLAALVDEALGLVTAGRREILPGWWVQGQAAIGALPDAERGALGYAVACAWRGVVELDDALVRPAVLAWRAEIEALTAQGRQREPGDDDGDDTPPTAPQAPTRARRTTAAAEGSAAPVAAPTGAVARIGRAEEDWYRSPTTVRGYLAGKGSRREIENAVRKHARLMLPAARECLLSAAAERLEALSPADEYGARITGDSLRVAVEGWAAEGPVTRKAA